jgi:hypothetical protein
MKKKKEKAINRKFKVELKVGKINFPTKKEFT